VHSATAAEISGGRLRAFWYGGSREGAQDVAIYSSLYSRRERAWSRSAQVMTREARAAAASALCAQIRQSGGPAATAPGACAFFRERLHRRLGRQRDHLMVSQDEGETWGPPRRLVASPVFSTQYLGEGSAAAVCRRRDRLPVYHEFLGKFGELLRLDALGHVIRKTRLSWGQYSAAAGDRAAIGSRGGGFHALRGASTQSHPDDPNERRRSRIGVAPVKTALPNPNAAIASVLLADGRLLLAFNNAREIAKTFRSRSRRISATPGASRAGSKAIRAPPVRRFRNTPTPGSCRNRAGDIHLLYTWGRSRIKHVRFNTAWLEGKR